MLDELDALATRVYQQYPEHRLTIQKEEGTFTIGYVFAFDRKWYLETPAGEFRSDMSGIGYLFEQAEEVYPEIRSWIPAFERPQKEEEDDA